MSHPNGDGTKTVDPMWYYNVANTLYAASKAVEEDLNTLDGKLDIARSAGTYKTGGPRWSTYFDQALVDIYELSSLSAMAARQLGRIIQKHGINHALADPPKSGPTLPTASATPTDMAISKNPNNRSVGATEGNPEHWDVVDPYVDKEWTNCSEGRIASAGAALGQFAATMPAKAVQMYSDAETEFTRDRQAQFSEIQELMTDVGYVRDGIKASGLSLALILSGTSIYFGGQAALLKTAAKALILAFYYYEQESKVRQTVLSMNPLAKKAAAVIAERIKKTMGEAIDKALGLVSTAVDTNVKPGKSMYDNATLTSRQLTEILGYMPRQTDPIAGTDIEDNKARGRRGEIRAGVDPDDREEEVTVMIDTGTGPRPVTVIPDEVDDENQQVIEVKDTNIIRPARDQILGELEVAKQKGYSMVLIVDHRTVIDDPMIQAKIDSGEIQLVRKILETPEQRPSR